MSSIRSATTSFFRHLGVALGHRGLNLGDSAVLGVLRGRRLPLRGFRKARSA